MNAAARRTPALRRLVALACTLGALAAGAAEAPATDAPEAAKPAAPADAAATKPASPTGAAPGVAVDLGHGLHYVRVSRLADELPAVRAALGRLPVVLDLRRAETNPVATGELAAALATAAADATGAVFLLVGEDSPRGLLAAIPASSRLVTLGAAASGTNPRVVVQTAPADDRAAYDAVVAGRPLAELTVEKIEKRRFDEARLSAAHANGNGRADSTDGDADGDSGNDGAPAAAAADAKDKKLAEAPVKDLVLQRAIFLHRALLALNRLPAHS